MGLVAPYLSYMRQDRRFKPGEAITSRTFARLLSTHLDWLVTAGLTLHRYTKLGEVYPIPARVVRSTPLLSEWISANVNRPFLLGPDMESKQWVSEVEGLIGAPYQVLRKTRRYGDRTHEIAVPDASVVAGHTPVLAVDDIVSSGRTMTVVADQLRELGLERLGPRRRPRPVLGRDLPRPRQGEGSGRRVRQLRRPSVERHRSRPSSRMPSPKP